MGANALTSFSPERRKSRKSKPVYSHVWQMLRSVRYSSMPFSVEKPELSIKSFDAFQMLAQEMFLQSVDSFHHGFEQFRESSYDQLQWIVERVCENFVVQISHEVNEESMLWTSEGIVCGVEIRDHDAPESPVLQGNGDLSPVCSATFWVGEEARNVQE